MSFERVRAARPASQAAARSALVVALGVLFVLACLVGAVPAWAADSEGCLICHSDPDFTNPTPAEGEPTSLYVDSKKFAGSVHGKLACSSCHKGFVNMIPAHQQDPTKDYREVAIEACETCHPEAYAAYQTSAHAKLFYRDQAGPTCISCHGSHEIRRVRLGQESADFKMSMARDSCGRCHKDKFEKASHELHFKALSLGYARAATCFDCHGFHDNLALKSGDAQTVKQCRQCHPGATAGFTYFQMHLDPGFENAWWGVRVVYLFFSTLLIVVLVTGIAYTTVHLQKETRTVLGVMGRGLGRLFGFIRALEEETTRAHGEGGGEHEQPPPGDGETIDDRPDDHGRVG